MILAILSDLHANAGAVRAALAAAEEASAERLLVLGDLVGYYYDAQFVCDAVRQWPHDCIIGNHDRMLLQARHDQDILVQYRRVYGTALDAALAELDSETISWLASLPERASVDVGGLRLELCHGSPQDPDRYVYPNASKAELDACKVEGADGVLMGHTHHAFIRPGNPWLANPGSVGQARDLGGFASWALLDTETGAISLRRTAYDPGPLLAEVHKRETPVKGRGSILTRSNPALGEIVAANSQDAPR